MIGTWWKTHTLYWLYIYIASSKELRSLCLHGKPNTLLATVLDTERFDEWSEQKPRQETCFQIIVCFCIFWWTCRKVFTKIVAKTQNSHLRYITTESTLRIRCDHPKISSSKSPSDWEWEARRPRLLVSVGSWCQRYSVQMVFDGDAPSLKLRLCPWKLTVGRPRLPFGMAWPIFQGQNVLIGVFLSKQWFKYCLFPNLSDIFSTGLKSRSVRQWLIGALGRWFGFLGSSYERDCYLGVPLEFQTTNPNH